MVTLYNYDKNGYATGVQKQQDEREPIPPGWTHHAPNGIDGERFVGGKWQVSPLPPEPVPQSISPRQGKQQLVIDGLDEQVKLAIDNITDPIQQKLTRIWYEDATEWERDNNQLLALANSLGLTDDQLDDMFKAASQL